MSGDWKGTGGPVTFTLHLTLGNNNVVTGTVDSEHLARDGQLEHGHPVEGDHRDGRDQHNQGQGQQTPARPATRPGEGVMTGPQRENCMRPCIR